MQGMENSLCFNGPPSNCHGLARCDGGAEMGTSLGQPELGHHWWWLCRLSQGLKLGKGSFQEGCELCAWVPMAGLSPVLSLPAALSPCNRELGREPERTPRGVGPIRGSLSPCLMVAVSAGGAASLCGRGWELLSSTHTSTHMHAHTWACRHVQGHTRADAQSAETAPSSPRP